MKTEIIKRLYLKNGWVKIDNFYTPGECDIVLDWITNCDGLKDLTFMQPQYEKGGKIIKKIRRLFWYDESFWNDFLYNQTNTISFIKKFVDFKPALIFHAAFLKPKYIGSKIHFHQDKALWDYNYQDAINFWVALDNSNNNNGCIRLALKSHLSGLIEHQSDEQNDHPYIPESKLENFDIESIEMEKGDVLIWNPLLVHGSGYNKSKNDRRAMVLVFTDRNIEGFRSKDQHNL